MRFFITLILLGFSASISAEPLGDRNGFLKPTSIKELEQQIKAELKKNIRIHNDVVEPKKSSGKKFNQVHWHPAIPGCTEALKHKHGFLDWKHIHKYSCRGFTQPRPSSSRRMAARRAVAPQTSQTNVQVQGVDEADIVKTDGRYLFALNQKDYGQPRIRIMDTRYQGSKLRQITEIRLAEDISTQGMYYLPKQQKLLVIGTEYSSTHIIHIDIRQRNKPRIVQHVHIDAREDSSRLIGDTLYLVVRNTNFLNLPSTYNRIQTEKPMTEAEIAVEKYKLTTKIDQWKLTESQWRKLSPTYTSYQQKTPKPLLKDKQFYFHPHHPIDYAFVTLMAIDLKTNQFKYNSLGYMGWQNTTYVSHKGIYLTADFYGLRDTVKKIKFPQNMTHWIIHKFGIKGMNIDYRGSGAVMGSFKSNKLSSFQMDENDQGHLRLITYNTNPNKTKHPDPASRSPVIVTAMAEHPKTKQLITLSRLPNKTQRKPLGKKNENLYGARLFNDYAYFVTFRRTDPLYVVDMRNSWKLKVTGELVIPGFSDYLHPISDKLLLGVGHAADNNGIQQGVKLGLYDISNPHKPTEIQKVILGDSGSNTPATRDHHAVTTLAMKGTKTTRLALPIQVSNSGGSQHGLYKFEIDRGTHRIKQLPALIPSQDSLSASWYEGKDRSVIIGDKVYFYHNDKFWQGDWRIQGQ